MKIKKLLSLVIVGFLFSIIIFFSLWALLGRFFSMYIKSEDFNTLFYLIIFCYLLSTIGNLVVSFWLFEIRKTKIISLFLITTILNFSLIALFGNYILFIIYPELFYNGHNVLSMFVIFSLYIMIHPINLMLLMILTHFIIFISILKYNGDFKHDKKR